MNMTMDTEQFSIRQLSEISGVNAVTLRAWERRYGLLKPQRTSKGHRFYTQEDVEKIRQIMNWLDRGVAISKVRPLLDKDQEPGASAVAEQTDSHWQDTINRTLELVTQFQREKLEQQLNELFGNYPLDTLNSNYFLPVQTALDRASQLRFGGSAEKIFFASELRADLMSRIRHNNSNNHGMPLLLIAVDGHQHGIQALLLALALLEAGYRLHLLFEACNLREIPYIIEQYKASSSNTIGAVICHSNSKPDILQAEQELVRAANHAHVPFLLGGDWLAITPSISELSGITTLPPVLRTAVSTIGHLLKGEAP